jgi:hypothetical protein
VGEFKINPDGFEFQGKKIVTYIETTYANAITAMGAGTLIPGATYKITDRGDRGLFFTAISTTRFAATGTRLMLCPATYATEVDGNGNNWLGVWHDGLTPAADDLVIWGGHVWKNLTGAVGSSVSSGDAPSTTLDAVNWVLVSKTSFTNLEYTELDFGIMFDWSNDWISKQWDKWNNVCIADKLLWIDFIGAGYNPTDVSDWNIDHSVYLFYNNLFNILMNNIFTEGIYDNNCPYITNNVIGQIYGCYTGGTGGVWDNVMPEKAISGNTCSVYGNTIVGDINNNTNVSSIYDCSGSISIFNNGHSTGDITGAFTEDVVDVVTDKTGA